MMAEDKPILVLGMSHVEAIEAALKEKDAQRIKVVNLNDETEVFDKRKNLVSFDLLPTRAVQHVFLTIRGNYHNIFGLLEHPNKICVGDAARGRIPDEESRWFITEIMVREHFQGILETASFSLIRALAAHYPNASMHYLSSPPPCGDENHIRTFPGVFRPRLSQGVSPMDLRRKLYDIQTDLFRQACTAIGVDFIDTPDNAVDAQGAMKREFWNRDPTHGNAAYGRLVLNQVLSKSGVA